MKKYIRVINQIEREMYVPKRLGENNHALNLLAKQIKRNDMFNRMKEVFNLWWGYATKMGVNSPA